MARSSAIVPPTDVESKITLLRGQRVLLDYELAWLYAIPTKVLVQSVKRNADRFPKDFMFRVTAEELGSLRSQIVTSNDGRGGRRYLPYALTPEGVAMLSSVLRSERAVRVNIEIMRAFVRMRIFARTSRELARQVAELGKRYDGQFEQVFHALRALLAPPRAQPWAQDGVSADKITGSERSESPAPAATGPTHASVVALTAT